jgi:hypothetical protein
MTPIVVPGWARRSSAAGRSLLVGLDTFAFLKRAQERLPSPRLDMRYLVEGALVVVAQPDEEDAWCRAAQAAMRHHVSLTVDSGTGLVPEHGAEGALARNQESSSGPRVYDPTCKSLLIGEDAFAALKLFQNRTRSPRLEMRYLVEGAIAVVRESAPLQPHWVRTARRVLHVHLSVLEQLPVDPFHLEIPS